MEKLAEPLNSAAAYYAAIKKNVLKAVTKLRQQQEEETAMRMLYLPSLNGIPEIEDERKKSVYKQRPKNGAALQMREAGNSERGLSFCFYPPFNSSSGFIYEHPFNLSIGSDEQTLYNPLSLTNSFTGEISLSAISGQSYSVYYGGAYPFFNGTLGYYNQTCGFINQTIELPTAFEEAIMLTITINAALPTHLTDVVELAPGDVLDYLRGIVGVVGYLDLLASYKQGTQVHVAHAPSVNFLTAWQAGGADNAITDYHDQPGITVQLLVPQGVTKIELTCTATIRAHSTNSSNGNLPTDTNKRNYGLVDFRRHGSPQIISLPFDGHDRNTPGAITVKSICVDFESAFTTEPNIN